MGMKGIVQMILFSGSYQQLEKSQEGEKPGPASRANKGNEGKLL